MGESILAASLFYSAPASSRNRGSTAVPYLRALPQRKKLSSTFLSNTLRKINHISNLEARAAWPSERSNLVNWKERVREDSMLDPPDRNSLLLFVGFENYANKCNGMNTLRINHAT